MTGTLPKSIEFGTFKEADQAGVLELQRVALRGGPTGVRTEEFFNWKHLQSPFGRSLLLVARDGERIVGLRSFMRWQFQANGIALSAVRAVDTATHPEYQGRGIFSRLTHNAVDLLRGEVDFIFNTPNGNSFPAYMKLKLGWTSVGKIPVAVRLCKPIRVAFGLRHIRSSGGRESPRPEIDAPTAEETFQNREGVAALLASAEEPKGISTVRDLAYHEWRYARAPELDYRCVTDWDKGALRGLAVFRVRPRGRLWESTISEMYIPKGDLTTARRLLSRVRRAAEVDHLTCLFPRRSASAAAAEGRGFVRMPRGPVFVVNPLSGSRPDPTDLRSWALTLGDVEVF